MGKWEIENLKFEISKKMKKLTAEGDGIVAISPEPGAVAALGGERKLLAPNVFRKPASRFFVSDFTVSMYEPTVVY